MRTNLLERRQKMLKLRAQAFPLSLVVNQLSEDYGVTPQAIYKDWRNRGVWQTQLLELGDLPQLCKDLYATHKEIYRMTVMEFLKGDNSNARVGALRLMRDLNLDFIEMFPRVIKSQIKDKRADDLNKLLKEYDSLFNQDSADKQGTNIKLSWQQTPVVDVRKLTPEERDMITAAVRLIAKHTQYEVVKLAYGSPEGIDINEYTEEERENLRDAARLMRSH